MRKWGPSTKVAVSRLAVVTPPVFETPTVASGVVQSKNVTLPPGLTAALPVGVTVAVTTAVCP